MKRSAEEINEQLGPLDAEIRQLRQQQDGVRERELKRQSVESRRKQMISDKERLKSNIRSLFEVCVVALRLARSHPLLSCAVLTAAAAAAAFRD